MRPANGYGTVGQNVVNSAVQVSSGHTMSTNAGVVDAACVDQPHLSVKNESMGSAARTKASGDSTVLILQVGEIELPICRSLHHLAQRVGWGKASAVRGG